jgi:hypothetical protein
MEQMNIPKDQIVQVEYLGASEVLKPVVFKEGDSYCCLLGPDPQAGVFGCGDTPMEALSDWDANLQARLRSADPSDPVVKYVREVVDKSRSITFEDLEATIEAHLASIKDPETAAEVKRFYEQFKGRQ